MARFGLLAAALLTAPLPALAVGADPLAANPADASVAPATQVDTAIVSLQGNGKGGGKGNAEPLTITIDAGIQFSLLALRGPVDGDALVDPVTGETKPGPNMVNLGGLSFQGKAVITGEPLRPIRIQLPTQVVLHSTDGTQARLTEFTTDLPGVALLDANGRLEFSFGAKIDSHNAVGGKFRGRIPIRVDYF
ncbi:DUF4402 domain-containing protein [Altererythrobacter salegens]|uniref:DUF4402 domain-containing protein n=1 Tax=Croceibacterium salegens TaxID=1737568 RepID=A0A6I4ST43_9SPHN|nr:DUF4402 domain-containing protein [Croceibacterium salegens]MXO58518.1 DUF4402 domain-containing protein [Croceibacterium salegens]